MTLTLRPDYGAESHSMRLMYGKTRVESPMGVFCIAEDLDGMIDMYKRHVGNRENGKLAASLSCRPTH